MVHEKHVQTGQPLESCVDELQRDFESAMEAVIGSIRAKHGVSEQMITEAMVAHQGDAAVQAARLRNGSVVSAGADYSYARTFVDFFYCTHNGVGGKGSCSNGQGAYFVEQVLAATPAGLVGVNCIGGTCQGEGAWTDPAGERAMIDRTLSLLVPRHGSASAKA